MKTMIVTVSIVAFAASAFAFKLPANQLNVTAAKSPRQAALEKKMAELKPSMPGKTPYQVCTAALAQLPPLPSFRRHEEASCNGYEGSPMLKSAADRAAGKKESEKLRYNATPVVKPK